MSDGSPQPYPAMPPAPAPLRSPSRLSRGIGALTDHGWTAPVCLALTLCTVFWTGLENGQDFYAQLGVHVAGRLDPLVLRQALLYTGALFAILGTHEMGHWIISRAHGVKTSLPVFIPVPFGIGTFGAVIAMKELPRTRRALLRIGAAGPLAGGVIALLVMIFALPSCPAIPADKLATAAPPGSYSMVFGSSLGMRLIEWITGTHVVDADDVLASPLFMAAWTGFLLTSINLFPVGQLDGGHVAYAIFGPVMNRLARPIAVAVIGLTVFGSFSYIGWGLLIFFLVSWHPPVPEPEEKLPADAWILALASLVLFALTFMVAPLKLVKVG